MIPVNVSYRHDSQWEDDESLARTLLPANSRAFDDPDGVEVVIVDPADDEAWDLSLEARLRLKAFRNAYARSIEKDHVKRFIDSLLATSMR